MSIIFDALKRAEAQAQKGQAPTLANVRSLSYARPKLRLLAFVSLFVVLGLCAWWFNRSSTPPNEANLTADTARPRSSATTPEIAPAVAEPQGDSASRVDLPPNEAPALSQNPVAAPNPPNPNTAELKANDVRLTVPSLDAPLTGAAQFNKELEPVVAAAPPVLSPSPAKVVEPKPAEVVVSSVPTAPPLPVAAAAPPPLAEPALVSVFELDYKVRHELPKMAVSMYVYNAQQQFRFVIIGGKRYAEGEQIESKVNITKIRADGLECDFQGTRFFYPRETL